MEIEEESILESVEKVVVVPTRVLETIGGIDSFELRLLMSFCKSRSCSSNISLLDLVVAIFVFVVETFHKRLIVRETVGDDLCSEWTTLVAVR